MAISLVAHPTSHNKCYRASLPDPPFDGHTRFTEVIAVGSAYFVHVGGALSGPSERVTVTRISQRHDFGKTVSFSWFRLTMASEKSTNQSSFVVGTVGCVISSTANGFSPPNDIDVASIDAPSSRLYMMSHALSVAAVQPGCRYAPRDSP
ncbi:hypothetical protein ASPBRDRAFT_194401 [Aspergillus brasiliensis CBS 101740]|uniref:Uncharacterized protein n=1 Tax=Aspergillus brasiliensis (strain CBS 101740 / IMI 381727 / IBT 21946) TaxID=767769 RepID=A0A1L9UP74_ASPBC|nr:hypothetical protein ASPBRDRAFT_194401 [Aspergillus brasiliensis CBS 101740]